MAIQHWKNRSLKDLSEIIDGVLYKEEWKYIPEYEGLYQISSFGRIKSFPKQWNFDRLFIMKLKKDKDKYLTIYVCKNGEREIKKSSSNCSIIMV